MYLQRDYRYVIVRVLSKSIQTHNGFQRLSCVSFLFILEFWLFAINSKHLNRKLRAGEKTFLLPERTITDRRKLNERRRQAGITMR